MTSEGPKRPKHGGRNDLKGGRNAPFPASKRLVSFWYRLLSTKLRYSQTRDVFPILHTCARRRKRKKWQNTWRRYENSIQCTIQHSRLFSICVTRPSYQFTDWDHDTLKIKKSCRRLGPRFSIQWFSTYSINVFHSFKAYNQNWSLWSRILLS